MTTPDLGAPGAAGAVAVSRAPRAPGGPPGAHRRVDGPLRAPRPVGSLHRAEAALRVPRPRVDLLRALLVLGTAASVALHGQMGLGGAHGPGWSALMGVMAVLCLSCLLGLVRAADPAGTVRMTMGMALAMALGHVLLLPLLDASSGAHGHHGHHAGTSAVSAASTAGAGHGGMLLVVGVELAVAVVAVSWLRRHNRRMTYRSV
ncbi:hypothetical protein ACH9DO_10480 [Kocuria sp. M1N1S27]|uniref:hypothetical protein n=1 Tax=Kocuria kalidii TaxID=3376283 RepID=UPI0037914207